MLIRKGYYTRDGYSGGEYYVNSYCLEAAGMTMEELERDVGILTKQHTSSGGAIDFGFMSGVQCVYWDDNIIKQETFFAETEEIAVDVDDVANLGYN